MRMVLTAITTKARFFSRNLRVSGAPPKISRSINRSKDVNRIASAASPDAPGDNRIANIFSALEYKQCFNDGTATFDDFYGGMMGKMGWVTPCESVA